MDEWWKTPPSLVGPPAVNPAIYGIDHTDVGLDEYVGMSGVASAQAGAAAPNPDRITHMKKADAGRAHAMQNQLLIAARNLEALVQRIDDTIAIASTKPDERGVDGYVHQLEAIVDEGEKERGKIVLVTKEKFADASVRDGVEHIDRAASQFKQAVERAKAFASQRGAKFDHDKHNADGEENNVRQLEHELHMTGIQTSHVKKVGESEEHLKFESFDESLDGLDHSTQALVLALKELDPAVAKAAMAQVLPSLMSNARMFQASLEGMKALDSHRKKASRIRDAMSKAMRDAKGLKLDASLDLQAADAAVLGAMKDLDKLPRGKK